ncbi:hypothetical protein Pyrfu_1511 [Pyrolobus fumarii 1A]|uniref:Uncharacterized protein n=1 Tax=Pyrolobus fumarii (strain DSM 11204 / 1A) TaxID=694429 RepID=G0EHL5_PYRF1|nr:hypothetical protein Pyrfu_1511 [Pyrolobus fumarii 1A]
MDNGNTKTHPINLPFFTHNTRNILVIGYGILTALVAYILSDLGYATGFSLMGPLAPRVCIPRGKIAWRYTLRLLPPLTSIRLRLRNKSTCIRETPNLLGYAARRLVAHGIPLIATRYAHRLAEKNDNYSIIYVAYCPPRYVVDEHIDQVYACRCTKHSDYILVSDPRSAPPGCTCNLLDACVTTRHDTVYIEFENEVAVFIPNIENLEPTVEEVMSRWGRPSHGSA